ncbi:MAG TPA: Ig-like domain-containing protein [Candidatus Wallbacteria bacterium]|nr:Ig-like domain-containing protein [Candidatus Wallbacteria bacterium]
MLKDKFYACLKNKTLLTVYFTCKILFLVSILGCNQSAIDPDRDTIGNPYVGLLIAPQDAHVITGEYKQFAVNAVDLNGKYTKVDAQWSASWGHITDKGEFVAPDTPGYALITAKFGTVVATTQIYVDSGNEISKFFLVPESGEIEVGRSIQFTCHAQNPGGDFLFVNPSWSCDNGNVTNTGFYSAPGSPMSATIKAQFGRLEALANLNVVPGAPHSVTISPQTAEVQASGTQQFMAKAYDKFGNLLSFKDFKWSTTYGDISDDGIYQGPASPGVAKIYATAGSASGIAYVNSTAGATAVSIDISPSSAVVSIGGLVQFTATAYDSSGLQVALPSNVTWAVDNGSVTSGGIYMAYPAKAGIANLSATAGSLSKKIVILVQ